MLPPAGLEDDTAVRVDGAPTAGNAPRALEGGGWGGGDWQGMASPLWGSKEGSREPSNAATPPHSPPLQSSQAPSPMAPSPLSLLAPSLPGSSAALASMGAGSHGDTLEKIILQVDMSPPPSPPSNSPLPPSPLRPPPSDDNGGRRGSGLVPADRSSSPSNGQGFSSNGGATAVARESSGATPRTGSARFGLLRKSSELQNAKRPSSKQLSKRASSARLSVSDSLRQRLTLSKGASPTPAPPRTANGKDESPNAIKASLSRFQRRSRKIFDRAAGTFNSESLVAFKNAVFELDPIDEPFLGAWMLQSDRHGKCSPTELMQSQQLLQTLSETRFDAMQRLLAFFVLFHSMGKACADFWPSASLGLLGYDMSRSQSIMRVATTASPVSGMEVRERMLAIRQETRRACAAGRIQCSWRAIRLARLVRLRVAERIQRNSSSALRLSRETIGA